MFDNLFFFIEYSRIVFDVMIVMMLLDTIVNVLVFLKGMDFVYINLLFRILNFLFYLLKRRIVF